MNTDQGKEPKFKVGEADKKIDLRSPEEIKKSRAEGFTELLKAKSLSPIEEQTNLVAGGSNTDLAAVAMLRSGVGNTDEHELKIIVDKIIGIEAEYVMRKLPHMKISTQISMGRLQELFYLIWGKVGNSTLEHWLYCEGYAITKLNNELPVQASVASKDDLSTVRSDNNSEKTMTSKDHSGLKEGEGKQSVNNELLKALEWAVSELDYIVEKNQDVSIETQLPFAKEAIQKAISAKSEPKVQVSNTDWKQKFEKWQNSILEEPEIQRFSIKKKEIEYLDKEVVQPLEQQLREANSVLRSCFSVIERKGETTYWEPLRAKVLETLQKQHDFFKENERLRNLLAEAEQK